MQARGLGGERRDAAVGERRRPGAPVPAAVAEIPRPGPGHRVAVDRRAEGAGVAAAGRRRAPRGARDAEEDETVAIVGGEGVDLRRRRRRDVADVTDAEVGLDRAVGGGPARGQVGAAGARAGQVLEVRDRELGERRELHRGQRGAVGVGRDHGAQAIGDVEGDAGRRLRVLGVAAAGGLEEDRPRGAVGDQQVGQVAHGVGGPGADRRAARAVAIAVRGHRRAGDAALGHGARDRAAAHLIDHHAAARRREVVVEIAGGRRQRQRPLGEPGHRHHRHEPLGARIGVGHRRGRADHLDGHARHAVGVGGGHVDRDRLAGREGRALARRGPAHRRRQRIEGPHRGGAEELRLGVGAQPLEPGQEIVAPQAGAVGRRPREGQDRAAEIPAQRVGADLAQKQPVGAGAQAQRAALAVEDLARRRHVLAQEREELKLGERPGGDPLLDGGLGRELGQAVDRQRQLRAVVEARRRGQVLQVGVEGIGVPVGVEQRDRRVIRGDPIGVLAGRDPRVGQGHREVRHRADRDRALLERHDVEDTAAQGRPGRQPGPALGDDVPVAVIASEDRADEAAVVGRLNICAVREVIEEAAHRHPSTHDGLGRVDHAAQHPVAARPVVATGQARAGREHRHGAQDPRTAR